MPHKRQHPGYSYPRSPYSCTSTSTCTCTCFHLQQWAVWWGHCGYCGGRHCWCGAACRAGGVFVGQEEKGCRGCDARQGRRLNMVLVMVCSSMAHHVCKCSGQHALMHTLTYLHMHTHMHTLYPPRQHTYPHPLAPYSPITHPLMLHRTTRGRLC